MTQCVSIASPEIYLMDIINDQADGTSLFVLRYSFVQYYLDDEPAIELLSVMEVVSGVVENVAVMSWQLEREHQLEACIDWLAVEACLIEQGIPAFSINAPIQLETIAILKPWGQEIWYTGIESRGQSRVTDGLSSVPLPWLLSLLPEALTGKREKSLNLLKILDPLPEKVYGDLYFEQHEEKQEVYVVTHIDEKAWPAGKGGIRIGFDEDKRSQYENNETCKAAFAKAVTKYEVVRRQIDVIIDDYREQQNLALDAPVSADQLKQWIKKLPDELSYKEEQLRAEMDSFKGLKPLSIGDVLKVPCYTPHSLQHGVRTIEFQTPVYERQIISFAQKVLTQDHWDTESALCKMNLDIPADDILPVISNSNGVLIEEVVSFDSFYVWRLTLVAGAIYRLNLNVDYAVLITVFGAIKVSGSRVSASQVLLPEQAALLSKVSIKSCVELCNTDADATIIMLSFPR